MLAYEEHLIVALSFSTLILALNIIAVISGSADIIYAPLNEWLNSLH